MIITTMHLRSACGSEYDMDLVTIEITNTGTGTPARGNYRWRIIGRIGQVLRCGTLLNWPRKSYTALALLQRVINDAYPRGAK